MKKIIITGIAFFVIVGAVIAIFLMKRSAGSVFLIPEKDYEVSGKIKAYNQRDKEWKDDTLGNSGYTIGSSGCVLTSIASAISDTAGAMDPKSLNTYFTENNVFDSEGNLRWNVLDSLSGFNAEVYSETSREIVDKCLDEGRYPIVRVRTNNGLGAGHYVLIVGAEEGEYICMDPLKGGFTTLESYGRKIFAVRCVWYE
ncbi:hypothetical protein SAMN06296386_11448 [Lachnospiraceae bacterium]|nr:hypothetical protein SAMN06296386_11448 [Lachnospiraceae bacterium]